jgi:peptidyl-prolyl cis-trans isomerase B (cyclophilin B)
MFVSTVRFSVLILAAAMPCWLSAQTPAAVSKPTTMPATTTATMIAPAAPAPAPLIKPQVSINTSMGEIVIELDPARAPVTVDNFMKYVKSGFYDGTIFHRVIPGFMVQGGGYMTSLAYKPTRDAIKSEANNGLKNTRGSVAMARLADPHSASSQFFVNTVDNPFLNFTSTQTPQSWGYTVFGRVIKGMDIVDKIKNVKTDSKTPDFADKPLISVVITKAIDVTPKPETTMPATTTAPAVPGKK